MIRPFFHRWEQRLADVSRHERRVRPFEWGEDWLDDPSGLGLQPEVDSRQASEPRGQVADWVRRVMQDTDAFYTPEPTREYVYTPAADGATSGEAGLLTFPSGFTTPHPENNVVYARYFPANPLWKQKRRTTPARRAIVVLAQWNADAGGHIGLCQLLAKLGIASLRISLPYHDRRMPPELARADYLVSSNIARTVQVCRQAVRDVRLALWWLRDQGYDRLGLVGTSVGSCLSLLTAYHEPLVKALALNHVSPFFGDVVWRGLSTQHVRQGLDGHVSLDDLRDLWAPISPWSFLDRSLAARTLMVYARYDLSFPVDLSRMLIDEWRRRGKPITVNVLPCGHYSTGAAPFKYLDAWYLGKFLATRL